MPHGASPHRNVSGCASLLRRNRISNYASKDILSKYASAVLGASRTGQLILAYTLALLALGVVDERAIKALLGVALEHA
jgi:hypothetical protein